MTMRRMTDRGYIHRAMPTRFHIEEFSQPGHLHGRGDTPDLGHMAADVIKEVIRHGANEFIGIIK